MESHENVLAGNVEVVRVSCGALSSQADKVTIIICDSCCFPGNTKQGYLEAVDTVYTNCFNNFFIVFRLVFLKQQPTKISCVNWGGSTSPACITS